ncbi:MAG TPA: hypothetical protein VFL79_19610 [Terriglobia bacterium]|nr:hypothetical protein [Terriglobia bacterium]
MSEKFPEKETVNEILEYMGQEFVRLRKDSIQQAWRFYLESMFHYQSTLREAISIENIIERGMKIEEFIKGAQERKGRTLTREEKLEAAQEFLTVDKNPKDMDDGGGEAP